MTKKETALILAKQYAEIEVELFKLTDESSSIRELRNTPEYDRDHYQFIRNEMKKVRATMETVEASASLLGISSNQWSKAIYQAYLTIKR